MASEALPCATDFYPGWKHRTSTGVVNILTVGAQGTRAQMAGQMAWMRLEFRYATSARIEKEMPRNRKRTS